MNYPNPIYRTQKVLTYLSELIHDYHYDHYYDLSESDKCRLAALLSEASGVQGEQEFIIESDNFDSAIFYFRKALSGTRKDNDKFLEVIKKNAIDYYDHTMEGLFNYVFDSYRKDLDECLDIVFNMTPDYPHKEKRE